MISCLCASQPWVFEPNTLGFLVDHHAIERKIAVISLKAVVVLPQPAEIGLDDLLNLLLLEVSAVKSPLHVLLPESVVVLPIEN